MIEQINFYPDLNLDPLRDLPKQDIERVASEFESLFIYYLLKAMRETIIKSTLLGNTRGEEIYRAMLDEELAKSIARAGGIGLRELILQSLKREDSPSLEKGRDRNMEIYKEMGEEFQLPIKGGKISSGYGLREDPISGKYKFHYGIDIAAPEGTPVHPARAGVVIYSGKRPGYGNVVEIRHDNGYITRYAHNQRNLVKEGDRVTTDDVIALVGQTGRATGPHIHFEIRIEGLAVNPAEIIPVG